MQLDLPQLPPLELVPEGRVWTVAEYHRGRRDGTTFSSHDSQMDAVRAAKEKMERDAHPCVLRWESQDSVANIYWNPLFEYLDVVYDDLVHAWTVVPERGTCAVDSAPSRGEASKIGKRVQREHDFKHLRVYSRSRRHSETRDHRFLRHDITDSGVRFDRERLDRQTQGEPETTTEEETDEPAVLQTGPATPGRLGVSIPDVTQVEFVDTNGVLNRYETPWGDGTTARIVALSRKYADHERARDAFRAHLDRWRTADDHEAVATVYESDTDPVPWVAYRAGEDSLATVGFDLPINERAQAVEAVADACGALAGRDLCGITPSNVRLRDEGGRQVTVANWGAEWAVSTALSQPDVTPFTAPEQVAGETTGATPVYQVAALAYWLFCEEPPADGDDLARTIQAGRLSNPDTISAVPAAVEDLVARGLAVDPDERPGSVHELVHELLREFR